MKLLNEALLASQIVRGRHRYLSTVLIRVPFAVLLQYRGYYCLAVELLTNDNGLGLGARPEDGRGDDEDDHYFYARVNSRYLDNKRLSTRMVLLEGE